jgi:hypothetical protein
MLRGFMLDGISYGRNGLLALTSHVLSQVPGLLAVLSRQCSINLLVVPHSEGSEANTKTHRSTFSLILQTNFSDYGCVLD